MARAKKNATNERKYTHENTQFVIRETAEQSELEIDGKVFKLRFLENGRPFTSEYVNSMAKDVEDYAIRFINFNKAQQKHWEAQN